MRTCTSTRTGYHPVSHASPVTKGARRSQEEGRRRVSTARSRAIARSFSASLPLARLFRPARIPCPAGPLEQCRSRGQRLSGFWGLPLEGECRGIQRVARCGASSLPSSLHSKEEEGGSVKSASCVATTAGPTPAAGEDSARRIRARVSYFENFVTEVEGLRLAQRSIRINQTSGCARGPSRTNRVCKRNAVSER
jgi:hypothetical protein